MGIKRTSRPIEGGATTRRGHPRTSPAEQAIKDATRDVFVEEGLGDRHTPDAMERRVQLALEAGLAIRSLRGERR